MDALKFAFEILIVGTLALPWLAVLIRIFSPGGVSPHAVDTLQSFLSVVPSHASKTVGVALIVAVGYLLGSAVSRTSRNFFNDELWGSLPTEDQIRYEVYHHEYCKQNLLGDLQLPELHVREHPRLPAWLCAQPAEESADGPAAPGAYLPGLRHRRREANSFQALVQEMFRLQEGLLLLNGQDKVVRLKEYADQLDVLRGAAFNGVILFSLCLFGCFGNLRVRLSQHRFLKPLMLIPACMLLSYGVYSLWGHWTVKGDARYSDPPLAEAVLIMLGLAGIYVTSKAKAETAQFYVRTCAVAAVLTVMSYGGWCWTEVMYDLQVIHSVPELPKAAGLASVP